MRVFINGTIDSATTAATGALTATTEPLFLGGDTTHLNGTLDEVSIFDSALSDAEITNLTNNRAGRYEYHHQNALGSNIVLTDGKKNVLARYEYDVFGAVRSETGTSDNTRKFTGKEYDEDVKLYKMGIRPYDPYTGRFTQRDPIGAGINWYAYAYNNPMAFIDPTGLRPANKTERADLIYTYGHTVGTFLAGVIDVEVVTTLPASVAGRVVSDTQILLNATHYKPNDSNPLIALQSRSVFIHESAHIWQRQTDLHRGGKGGQDYTYTWEQLRNLELDKEEHAEAVQDWFYVMYGRQSGLLTSAKAGWGEISKENLRWLLDRYPNSPAFHSWNRLMSVMAKNYTNVINEIRDPGNLPRQGGWRARVINYFAWFK